MKRKMLFLFTLFINIFILKGQDVPLPTAAQMTWQDAELVALLSYDLHVFDGKNYVQSNNRIQPIPDVNIFNPTELDTDQWIKTIKKAGFKMAILTVTHETGFALYQSDVNPYCLKTVKWRNGKGDIVKDFVKSCQKYGIKAGIFVGIRWNSFMGVHDFKVQGDNEFSKNRQQFYNKMCEGMVKELCTRYGDWSIIWFDGGAHGPAQGGPDVLSIVEKHQPNCLFYHNLQRADMRWGGSESGTVPYPCWGTFTDSVWFNKRGDAVDFKPIKYGYPDGKYYIPAMSDAPLRGYKGRHEWFWEPNDEAHIFPVKSLLAMYDKSVGHNTSLILGLTPDDKGRLPKADSDTLLAFGNQLKVLYSNALSEKNNTSDNLILDIPKGKKLKKVVVEEAIEQGERVRSFLIKGKKNGQWETVFEGSCIGHRFIFDCPLEKQNYEQVALEIVQAVGKVKIKRFAVF